MGVITGANITNFKSTSILFSKIKREFKSFASVNLIDDLDFPTYVAEVLNMLGIAAFKEEEVIITVKKRKALLPKDFKQLYAAYKCTPFNDIKNHTHLQNTSIIENNITSEIIKKSNKFNIECEYTDDIIERVTIKQYVNDSYINTYYKKPILLRLSPNVKSLCSDDCLNLLHSANDEISINNGLIHTNFDDGDILLKYYAFPIDEEGLPMIPDIIQVEKACEWYIKHQLLLNFWLVDDLTNAVNKWQKAEQEYENWMAEARYILKLPAFSTLINSIKTKRSINGISFFSQQDFRR